MHGHTPEASAFVAQDADAATILLDAVAQVAAEQADGSLTIDPAALRDAVRATSLEDGLSGSFAFDENGDRIPRKGEVLSQVVGRGPEPAAISTSSSTLAWFPARCRTASWST